MRKQYHFRKSDKGLLAWNIHRLIELSRNMPVIKIPLIEIKELDETFWYDLKNSKPSCRNIAEHARLIMEVDLNYPIILSSNGRVMDGMHRICKAYLDGAKTIKAVRFEIDPEPDYIGVEPEDLPY